MSAPDWVVVQDYRHDLPVLHKRCLFKLHSGFCFYGERADSKKVVAYLYGRVYSCIAISQWQYAPLLGKEKSK